MRAIIALWLRPRYMHAVTVTYSLFRGYTPAGSYWQLARGIKGPNGQVLPQPNGTAAFGIPSDFLPHACAALTQAGSHVTPSCRAALAAFRGFVTYQPASRYWAFQGIETAIFVALAAILVAEAAAVLLRRDA